VLEISFLSPPAGAEIGGRVVGERDWETSVGAHQLIGGEGEEASIWRPGGIYIVDGVVGELDGARAVGVDDIDLLITVVV
jgi:hypothetical protein